MIGIAVESADILGEGALWSPTDAALYWLDLHAPALHRLDPATGAHRRIGLDAAAPLGAIALTNRRGTLLLAHRDGLALLATADGRLSPFAAPESGRVGILHNDAKVDRWGRLWVGTSDAAEAAPRGALWCLAAGRPAVMADAGFVVSNGPAFSPDGRTLYFSESLGRRILAYDIAPDRPQPLARRTFVEFAEAEGYPDGVTVDAEGCLWVAHWDGWRVTRLSPSGERLQAIAMPVPRMTSLAFGGSGLETLYATSARLDLASAELRAAPASGHLFAIAAGVAGLPETAFVLGA